MSKTASIMIIMNNTFCIICFKCQNAELRLNIALAFTPGDQSVPSYHNWNTLNAVITFLLIYAILLLGLKGINIIQYRLILLTFKHVSINVLACFANITWDN